MQCAEESGITRHRATHAWLGNQIPGAGQEFALGKLLLNPLAPQAPCLLDRGQGKQESWVRPDQPANASSLGVRAGLGGAQQTCRMPGAGQSPRARQVSAAPTSQWKSAGFPKTVARGSNWLQITSDLARTTRDPG